MVCHMKVHVEVYYTYLETGSSLRSRCGLSHEGTCSGLSQKDLCSLNTEPTGQNNS